MNDVPISRLSEEDPGEDLFPLIYNELRNLASARMLRESAGHTLQPTALVHEAWLRLTGPGDRQWKDPAYFFASAAQAMRRILVEHARRKARYKRGGGQNRLNLDEVEIAQSETDENILLVNEALDELETAQPERARVVVLKYFGGMTNAEVAEAMGISERSVNRHWECAKVWLAQKLEALH